jgi:hypothetical protein
MAPGAGPFEIIFVAAGTVAMAQLLRSRGKDAPRSERAVKLGLWIGSLLLRNQRRSNGGRSGNRSPQQPPHGRSDVRAPRQERRQ